MEPGIQHPELLTGAWPTAAILLLAVVSLGGWIGAHVVSRRIRGGWLWSGPLFLLRTALGVWSLWLVCNVLARTLQLATSWSIVGVCVLSAVAVELSLALYGLERRFVTRRLGVTLAALRVAMILVVGGMLLQPVFAWSLTHSQQRTIAILLDDSGSMQIADPQLTDSEKLRLISVFDPSIGKPPYDLSTANSELTPLADRLALAAGMLEELAADSTRNTQQEFPLLRRSIDETLVEAQNTAGRISERIRDLLTTELRLQGDTLELARQLQERLDTDVSARLVTAEQLIADHAGDIEPHATAVVGHLNSAAASVREIIGDLPVVIDAADRSFFASLPLEKQQQAEHIVAQTRAGIARALLAGDRQAGVPGIVDELHDGYAVWLFRFNRVCSELDLDRLPAAGSPAAAAETAADAATTGAATDPRGDAALEPAAEAADGNLTDLAAALDMVRKTIPAEQLAGVLLISDGRHNAGGDVEAAARQLGARDVPLSAVVLGSSRPPVDAAILDVESPATILVDDLLNVGVRVRLNGFRGRAIRAKLVEQSEVRAEKTLTVPSEAFTTTVMLGYVPEDEGVRNLRVEIEPVDGDAVEAEAFADNNSRSLSVAVTDNRTEVLFIEGRPRWEYGYLRNLFAGRDVTVKLQTVLFEPERLLESSERPAVHASVSREEHELEATRLPADESEWMKFDVVILGDVAPEDLPSDQLALLKKFVGDRGGALIVIAGMRNMPHRFAGTPLQEILPIEFAAADGVVFQPPEESFRFRPSDVGLRHVVLQQADAPDESLAIWGQMPEFYWRHAVTGIKPGAAVLAYAGNEDTERAFLPQEGDTPEVLESRRSQHREFIEQNALLAVHSFGAGRVMALTTDRTWRFRYRIGDTRHHRFWGQVLRWATAEKLQAGTEFVQIGTDRVNYEPGQPVEVTAKLTDSFFAPIDDPDAIVKVFRGDDLVLSKKLTPAGTDPGLFRAELGQLPESGAYRVVLESPAAQRIFAGEEEVIETVVTVEAPEVNSPELLEPTADRDFLSRLAAVSGGTMVEADALPRVLRSFGPGTSRYTEQHTVTLWDSWPLLMVLLLLLTTEWTIRKIGGLI